MLHCNILIFTCIVSLSNQTRQSYDSAFTDTLRAQSYTTTLQVILTCSSQNHQDAQVYTTALQALFSRIYWIFFDVPARAELHYNTTGDFHILISKPSDAQGLH